MKTVQLTITASDSLFERLGVGLIALHGSTVIRASTVAAKYLQRDPLQLVGRDLMQLFETEPRERLREWIAEIYRDPVQAGSQLVDDRVAGSSGRYRLTASLLEGGSANTRAIAVEALTFESLATPAKESTTGEAHELRRTLRELLDGNPVPTFVINTDHIIMHWNHACEGILGANAKAMVGTRAQWRPFYAESRPVLADLIVDGVSFEDAQKLYTGLRRSIVIPDGLECTAFFPSMGKEGRWLLFTAAPIRNAGGAVMGAIETLVDISELKSAEQALRNTQGVLEDLVEKRTTQLVAAKRALEEDIAKRQLAEQELLARYAEMTELNTRLGEANNQIQEAQNQLVQNEKLASIGQLAAGVAHEINNPIGYIFSNFGTLETYIADMLKLLGSYREAECHIGDAATREHLGMLREQLDIDFLQSDTQSLMNESREGIERVRKIVQDLKDFSRVDSSNDWQWADLHRGLESTLNIVNNEIKYCADVVREFGDIPQIQCLPSQLNQVFMNLLVNAGHAMDTAKRGTIAVRTTSVDDAHICVEISDSGCGMSEETLGKIFDPFFTTKPVGRGTGLGLSLSYGIVKKHNGRIEVQSTPGVGTTFRVILPVRQSADIVLAQALTQEVHA